MISANPISWVDQALTRKWDALTARVRPEWLPRQISGKKVRHFQEFGCGHYGCVYPTAQPGIVFKVTSDPTEAFFVAYVLRTKQQVDGLVRYYQVLAIEGESRRNRPVFIIVRDEAMHVGNVREVLDGRETHSLRFSLYYMQDLAKRMREVYKKLRVIHEVQNDPKWILRELDRASSWTSTFPLPGGEYPPMAQIKRFQGVQRLALAYKAYRDKAEEMYSTQHQYLLGEAFMTYLDDEIILADVHMGNIGMPIGSVEERVGSGEPIIVDPGHTFALDSALEHERIDVL